MKQLDIWEEYRKWLLWRVHFSRVGYSKLLEYLHNYKFTWLIDNDRRRCGDAMTLRQEFFKSIDLDTAGFNQPCGILEVLVAFAIRIDDEWVGSPGVEQPDVVFWEMIQNLHLDREDNRSFSPGTCHMILSKWLDRNFSYNGEGSIFQLRHPDRDQRDVEMWSQMCDWIKENYD